MGRQKIVVASGNAGKLAEFREMLEPRGMDVVPQSDFGVVPPPEIGRTFVENALIKARAACEAAGRPALADDSGLVVRALAGRPGIHSARFAGDGADDDANIDKLLAELEGLPAERRGAFFYCCLVLLKHADDPAPLIATGRWYGYILESRRGTNGFGYDPVFHDPERGASAAELPAGEKNRISHRGRALDKLVAMLDDLQGM
ncbi:MAG: RdgB/HAM1 family non-canonical purine NTP pyrophosphatase [Wenzhouxiangellaceae bacterium]|nr:RdgB/HAM1 family non-canonical purine NTP pyrophosphatase [Wenzhouxiangellaceae bacterium]